MIIKLIAMITMLIDHIGSVFFPNVLWLRFIGRIAFVLYAFMIAEGVKHTRNIKLYLLKLFGLACVSEPLFDFVFHNTAYYPDYQNVVITLFLGAVTCFLLSKSIKGMEATIILIASVLTVIIKSDYPLIGVLLIVAFYYCQEPKHYLISIAVFAILQATLFKGNIPPVASAGCLLAIPVLSIPYDTIKPKPWFRYLYWLWYPLHMLLLMAVKATIL